MSTSQERVHRDGTTICIFGVTGSLGSLIAMHLLAQPSTLNIKVRGFCRDRSKVSPLLTASPYFTSYEGDALSASVIRPVLKGSASAICTYNNIQDSNWMITVEKTLIDACEAEEVKRYFPANYSGNFTTIQKHDFPLVDPMIEVYKYLQKGKDTGRLKTVAPVHVLAAGYAEILFQRFLNIDDLIYYGEGDRKWGFSCYDTCARFIAKVVVDETEPTGFLKFGDFQASVKEIAAMVSKVKKNDAPVSTRRAGSEEELEELVKNARANGTFFMNLVPYCHYYFSSPEFGVTKDLDNSRYSNVKTITLEEAIEKWVG